MRSALVRSVAVALASLLSVAAVGAQQPTHANPASAERGPGPWAIGFGVNSTGLNLGTERPGTRVEFFSSLSRYWSLSSSLSFRTQAIAGAQTPRALTLNEQNGCPECEVWSSRQFAGINSALVYEMRHGKAFRPYVLGGAGLTFMHVRQRLDGACATTNTCTFVDPWLETRSGNFVTLGYMGGAGAAFRIGKTDLFAEYTRYSTTRASSGLSPLSIGLRF